MTYTKYYKAVLLIVFSLFVSTISAMDHRRMFAEVWQDNAKTTIARDCFLFCCTDDKRILNVTKHLIGHKHMMAISEIGDVIPASWLLATPEGEDLFLFKFLRELYTVRDVFNRLQMIPEGQLDNQRLLSFLKNKSALLQQLRQTFEYAKEYDITRDQSEKVLEIINGIDPQTNLVEAKKSAEAFVRQLNQQQQQRNPGFIDSLPNRIGREIQKYEAGGVNVDALRAHRLNVGDLNPLIILVQNVEQTPLVQVDWAAITNQIREAVNAYFQAPLLEQINDSVQNLFVPTIRSYANNFAELGNAFDTVEGRVEKEAAQISAVALSFLRAFEPAA